MSSIYYKKPNFTPQHSPMYTTHPHLHLRQPIRHPGVRYMWKYDGEKWSLLYVLELRGDEWV